MNGSGWRAGVWTRVWTRRHDNRAHPLETRRCGEGGGDAAKAPAGLRARGAAGEQATTLGRGTGLPRSKTLEGGAGGDTGGGFTLFRGVNRRAALVSSSHHNVPRGGGGVGDGDDLVACSQRETVSCRC